MNPHELGDGYKLVEQGLNKPGEFRKDQEAVIPVEVLRELLREYNSAHESLNQRLLEVYDDTEGINEVANNES